MKGVFAHFLLASLLFADFNIHIKQTNDEIGLPLSKVGTLYFDNGSIVSSENEFEISLEEINRIYFSEGKIESVLSSGHDLHSAGSFTLQGSKLNLSLPEASQADEVVAVSLVNMQGRVLVLKNVAVTKRNVKLDLASYNLATGIYSLVCHTKSKTFVQKLVLK